MVFRVSTGPTVGDQVVCELPSSAKRGISGALLGGWQSAGILVMQSCQRLESGFPMLHNFPFIDARE